MYIIGTSGHIDHGKTSLIMALTGTDCDRLPEEKARGMTIDIGFAGIDYAGFGMVGIIDVPGHERFIRNMVAGAWGIDVGLLVVAVDDGWMPQTEDHFRVLAAIGVERLIVVLNKTDIADDETIEMVEAEITERLKGTPYEGSEMCRVSSKTGSGIAELKALILKNLKKLQKAQDSGKPYLFVDRVFASKGYGTVVTGTLKNGAFKRDEDVTVLPLKKGARIKRIESHGAVLGEGGPAQRTALNLSGVSAEELRRGHIICGRNFFTETREFYARIELFDEGRGTRNNSGIEVLAGTSDLKGKLIFTGEINGRSVNARIRLDGPCHLFPGEKFVITAPGGFRILGGGTVLKTGAAGRASRSVFMAELAGLRDFSPRGILSFIVISSGWISRDRLEAGLPYARKWIEKTLAELSDAGAIKPAGDYVLSPGFMSAKVESLTAMVEKGSGLNIRELSDSAGIDVDLCRILVELAGDSWIEKDGKYFSSKNISEDDLSADRKDLLDGVYEKGAAGVEIDRLADDPIKKKIRELVRLGFLVSLDGNIVYHKKTYEGMKKNVMALFESRDKLTVPEAKDATGLSRKYVIPLLNKIESEGLIKRLGDFRIKSGRG
ncbi:MAG: selenocysteine-specific translation elongation factor [Spirochaetes bacterium]|jgi:selenocysteine-specific elongation factor|nr:selenocysteine-specific translation elongation factor [Spirochaetota bacterium]